MGQGKKKPKFGGRVTPRTKKLGRPGREQEALVKSAESSPVEWCFARFDKRSWFDDSYKPRPFNEVAGQLKSYWTKTWRQLRTENPHYNHPIPQEQLILEAQKRLVSLKYDDFDEIWRLRFGGCGRLWGLKSARTFFVLWWDPQHRIYASKKREG